MIYELRAAVIVELVLRVLQNNGIDVKQRAVKATVERLIGAGESLLSIPAKAVEALGYPDLKDEAGKAARVELNRIKCPLNPDEQIVVSSEPGEYVCPSCGLDIVVDQENAEHERVLGYTCPEGHTDEFVSATEGEGYRCQGCGMDVNVVEESGSLKVFHQLSVVTGKPTQHLSRLNRKSSKKTNHRRG